ncbi:helix-turn-helix transcriptional regulator [Bacillus sp. 03113]|uniref:ArsR/SmtB family transcription factor n=1 Tax=Bacillus sp. 03113 TaxID=2578211 RepID=UPI001143F545|nr:winged helix-turn-helix domain-containing protein [Bacillus sp. 03113]
MDVLNVSSRKRETYKVKIKYSVLWECVLGIAAITNTPILHTLEKTTQDWEKIKQLLSKDMLDELCFVEEKNTWKALLQLLHQKEFKDVASFLAYIKELSEEDLKFICIPFIGEDLQEKRRLASNGVEAAIQELKMLTKSNPFFPDYIEFICKVDEQLLKAHLTKVMSGWYKAVIEPEFEKLLPILERDAQSKIKMSKKMTPEELVEWSTGGVTYLPEPSVHHVLLIPQYTYRPWNIEADIEDTKVFFYPIANESIAPHDKYLPNYFLVQKYKALGDEARLRIVKLLYERDRTLQELTEQLNIGKSTIHHHLKLLRAAKLVEIIDSKYSLKSKALDALSKELNVFLDD